MLMRIYAAVNNTTVRCALCDNGFHSRMLLVPTPLLRLKRCQACDQWCSSRASAASHRLPHTFRPNTGFGFCHTLLNELQVEDPELQDFFKMKCWA
jgi:hypothetical protein